MGETPCRWAPPLPCPLRDDSAVRVDDSAVRLDSLTCHVQGRFRIDFPETPGLNWSLLGVYKVGGVSEDPVIVNRCQVRGKVIKVLNFLLTCPANILLEK